MTRNSKTERGDKIVQRESKVSAVKDFQERFGRARALFIADYRGVKVAEITVLRKSLREASVDLKVVKNTFAKIALKGTNGEPISDFFSGPTVVALSYGDPVATAKILSRFAGEQSNFKLKAGFFGGRILDINAIKLLSELPSKEVLLGKLVGLMQGAGAGRFVNVLSGVMRKFVYILDAIKTKKGN